MAQTLVGEAAIRIVPSTRGFRAEADRRLKEMRFEPIKVRIDPGFAEADAQMDSWRARQALNPVSVPIKGDFQQFQKDLSQVEHIFKRSSLSRAIRLNVKVIGLDALPALAYAAGSAASGLDALAKSAFALPGILAGVGSSVGALLIGMNGLKEAFQAYSQDSKNATQQAEKQANANREVERSYRDYRSAVRDTIREIQDLNAENRRSSLSIADAALGVQDAADRLRKGGFTSFSEYQHAQLGYLEALDHLQEVQVKAQRTAQDTAEANAKGVQGADKVVTALEAIASNTQKLNDTQVTKVSEALSKLSPNAREAVEAIHGLSTQWKQLENAVQDNLWAGMGASIQDLAKNALPGLQIGLARVATGLNTDFKAVFSSLGSREQGGLMQRIFGNTSIGLDRAAKGITPLVEGFTRLSAVSSEFLPRMADGFDKVMNRFNEFTKRTEADGSMSHWIDSGLKAIDSLGNTVIHIGSIISSVSKAFDEASGHSGGFVKTLDDATKRLADLLKSKNGQDNLANYFRQAHEFISQISSAIKEMRPFIHEVVEESRQWSAGLFTVVGGLTQAAEWIDRNTGLLKVLVDSYLLVKTVKPIVEGVTGAWKNYAKVMEAAAKFEGTSRLPGLQTAAQNISIFRGEVDKFTIASEKAQRQFPVLKQVASEAVPPLNNIAGAAGNAASAVGGTGKTSLLGRIGALGQALAPGAALMVGIPLVIGALDSLGDAHSRAAQEAQAQANALANLKSAVDGVTGAVTTEGLQQTLQTAQKYPVQGFGDQNLISNFVGAGLGNPQQFAQALLPANQGLNDQLVGRSDEKVAQQLEQTDMWRKYGEGMRKAGFSPIDVAKALRGDPESLSKFRSFREHMKGGKDESPEWVPFHQQWDTAANWIAEVGGGVIPDLQQIRQSLPDGAKASLAGQGLSQLRGSLVDSGQLAQQVNQAQNGHGRFKDPTAAGYWMPFGAMNDDAHISIDPSGDAIILTNVDPHVDSSVGTTTKVGSGYQTKLTQDATNNYIQKFADGGMVRGPGGPRDDNILVRTSAGEHVTNADAVKYYGVPFFDALNNKQIPKAATGAFFGFGNMPLDFPPPAMPNPAPAPRPMGPFAPAAPAEPTWGGGAPNLGPPTLNLPSSLAPADVPDPVPAPVQTPNPVSVPSHVGFDFGGAGTGGGSIGPGNGVKDPGLTPSKLPLYATGPLWPGNPGKSYGAGLGQLDNWNDFGDLTKVTDTSKFGQWWQGADAPKPKAPATQTPTAPSPHLSGTVGAPGPGGGAPAKSGNASFNAYMGSRDILSPKDRDSFDAYWRGQGFDPTGSAPASVAPPAVQAPRLTTGVVPQGAPVPSAPIYAVQPSMGGGVPTVGMSGPTSQALQQFAASVAGKVPYKWGGFGPDGMDCSGLAAAFANIATGHGPFDGGRSMSTANEGPWLTARGFVPGPGGPGTLTIGWSDSHTGVTLPDGTHIDAQGDATGIVAGPGSQGATGFPNVMHLPIPDSSALNNVLATGMPGGFPGMGMPGIGLPGGSGPGLGGLPKELQPMNIAAQFGKIALGALAGFFGIDTSYLNDIDQVANFYLGKGLKGGFGGPTDANAIAAQGMGDYLNGQSGLSGDMQSMLGQFMPGFNGSYGTGFGGGNNGPLALGNYAQANGFAGPGGLGGPGSAMGGGSGVGGAMTDDQIKATYGPIIAQVCQALGVDPAKWVGPLEKQISTESRGNIFSLNTHDSNGHGGEQTVAGLFNFLPATFDAYKVPGFGSGSINDPVSQIAAAINYTKQKWGMSPDGSPLRIGNGIGFANGGSPGAGLAYVSSGEYRSNPSAVAHYGPALFAALNNKQIPRSVANGFARGGFPGGIPRLAGGGLPLDLPILPQPQPQTPSGQAPGPLSLGTPAPPNPQAGAPPGPDQGPDMPPPMPGGGPGISIAAAPGTGGQPGPGATAPAPDPGSLPGVQDALSAIGGAGAAIGGDGGGGLNQPGASQSDDGQDQRGILGAAPTSNDHNLPALSQGIQGAASTIGSLAATAAQLAIDGGTMGVGAAGGGSAAAAGIQAGAQMAGQVATGAVNILSSLMVGTLTGGSTGSASGVPLLPQRQPVQNGVAPIVQRVHNGDINVTNLDEYKRTQERIEAQQSMPYISKYNA